MYTEYVPPQHKITSSYNPQVNDVPRPRQPNENPKDYMLNNYKQLIHVLDLTPTTSIYRLDPFAKYLCCWINYVCNEEVGAIQERTRWKQPNLVSFLFFEDMSDRQSPQRALKIYYEYLPLDVSQLIARRQQKQEYVPENELWSMINGLTGAMLFLQKRGITHSALTLESVYFDEEYLIYRIQDVSPFRARAPQMFENQFQAPEGTLRVNKFKADVFSMGMIIVSLALLQDCSVIYDTQGFNRHQFISLMERLKSLYPGRVESTLWKMLYLDHNERPDWIELQAQLQLTQNNHSLTQSVPTGRSSVPMSPQLNQSVLPQAPQAKIQKTLENTYTSGNNQENTNSQQLSSIDQKLMLLNKRIQETLAKSQGKALR